MGDIGGKRHKSQPAGFARQRGNDPRETARRSYESTTILSYQFPDPRLPDRLSHMTNTTQKNRFQPGCPRKSETRLSFREFFLTHARQTVHSTDSLTSVMRQAVIFLFAEQEWSRSHAISGVRRDPENVLVASRGRLGRRCGQPRSGPGDGDGPCGPPLVAPRIHLDDPSPCRAPARGEGRRRFPKLTADHPSPRVAEHAHVPSGSASEPFGTVAIRRNGDL